MNSRILIVAAREFRQITRTRSFWITLLLLPLALAVGPVAQRFLHKDDADRVLVIDRSGGIEARAISDRFELDHGREVLTALSRYVQRHKLEHADPAAPWASHDRWYSDEEVRRFQETDGVDVALGRIRALAPKDANEFERPKPDFTVVATPASLDRVPDEALGRALQPLLHPTAKGAKAIDYAVLIPADFGRSPAVRLWSSGTPGMAFVATLQDVLTRDLRQRYLLANGVSPASAAVAGRIAPALAIATPPPGSGAREAMVVRSILPLAAAYMLMMSLMLSGSWMLQGMVEERSNKLLETVLACVSPEELMYGKLLGLVGVGLSMIAVWIGCGLVAAYAGQGAIADFVRPALAPLTSLGTIAALLYFFVVGFVSTSIFFLAIGVMSDSMRDAQGYLTPVILLIVLPVSVLIQAVLAGGGGIGVEVLTWVPFWTPFAILARLGTGIPAWEVVGTAVMLAAVVAVELALLGRLFRASLLSAGQKVNLAAVFSRFRASA